MKTKKRKTDAAPILLCDWCGDTLDMGKCSITDDFISCCHHCFHELTEMPHQLRHIMERWLIGNVV